MKLITTVDYLLLIDEEAEIKYEQNSLIYENDTKLINTVQKNYKKNNLDSLVVSYYPLISEAKELDLPLLPNPFEEVDAEDLAKRSLMKQRWDTTEDLPFNQGYLVGFVESCKAAQSKQFSLEDMKKAIEMAREEGGWSDNTMEYSYTEEEIIQSLSTQQLPKEFIPEYDKINDFGEPYTYDDMDFGVEIEYKLKTITDSNGIKILVGTYKY